MVTHVAGVICCLAALFFIGLARSYFYLPHVELKRRITRGKSIYRRLDLVATYGERAKIFFISLGVIFGALGVIYIARSYSYWYAVLLTFVFIAIWTLLFLRTFPTVAQAAAKVSPVFERIFENLKPVWHDFQKIPRPKRRPKPIKTNIFEKEDLVEVISRQKLAANNRIDTHDLDNALHALEVRTKRIKDHMVKRKDIHFVNMKEPIGPILLSELHKSGFSVFPVQGNSKHEVVGLLHLEFIKGYTSGGLVTDAMDSKVYYVHDDKKLEHVLQAYTMTGCSVFMVLNMREQVVGLITVTDVLEELFGQSIYSEFESYDDKDRVAHS